jgi:hypothetical protein
MSLSEYIGSWMGFFVMLISNHWLLTPIYRDGGMRHSGQGTQWHAKVYSRMTVHAAFGKSRTLVLDRQGVAKRASGERFVLLKKSEHLLLETTTLLLAVWLGDDLQMRRFHLAGDQLQRDRRRSGRPRGVRSTAASEGSTAADILTLALPPAIISPRLHDSSPLRISTHAPAGINVTPVGSVSLTTTFVASEGPKLSTFTVYVN